jgi:hypothetical protein
MNHQQAKEILALYRPGSADANDPAFADALSACERDAELNAWFQAHCDSYHALRKRFKQISVPEGLKEQILAERKVHTEIFRTRRVVFAMAAAVAVAMLAGLLYFWFQPPHETALSSFQNRMASAALRGYDMNLETSDLEQIRTYLAQQNAPADYTLPQNLKNAEVTGCAIQTWQGSKVSMICFRTGKPLAPGEKGDLWLFVANRAAVKGAPESAAPLFSKVNRLITATWTQGDRIYFLGTRGKNEAEIQRYL